jgi:L-ribulose-5-phosphate 3-epimerase
MEIYRLGLYEKSMPTGLGIAELLSEAKAAGYDYLELSIDESEARLARLEWSEAELRDLRGAQDSAGLPIKSICLSAHRRFPLGHPDPEVQARSLGIMEKAIGLASRLGPRLIQLAGYDIYYEPSSDRTREIFARNLERAVELAAREGVVLAFETMETEFMNTVSKAAQWVERMRSPYLQIYPDIGNLTNAALQYGTALAEDLESGRGHLVALHLKETRPEIFRDVPYGQGHVDFSGAAELAFALGLRLFVGEFWHDGSEAWREALRRENVFLRGALAEGWRRFVAAGRPKV